MATIKYELSPKMENGRSEIRAIVSVSRRFRVECKTRICIEVKDWDSTKCGVRRTSKVEKKSKQLELQSIEQNLHRLEEHIKNQITNTTSEKLEEMDGKTKREWILYVVQLFYDPSVSLLREQNLTFDKFADVYVDIRSREEQWEVATRCIASKVKKWNNPRYDKLCAVRNHMVEMCPTDLMEDMTPEILSEYQLFLSDRGFKNSTINNNVCYLKEILQWAGEHGYFKYGKELESYKVEKLELIPPTAYNYLTWDEFKKMYEVKFQPEERLLEIARDRFCFGCITSLRHSDISQLKKSHFDDVLHPEKFQLVIQKTAHPIVIPMSRQALEIYNRYKDNEGDYLFPNMTNQQMNRYLKEIAKSLNFTREVSWCQNSGKKRVEMVKRICDIIGTHSARRTFVVHATEKNWTELQIISFTGHKSLKTLKPYLDLNTNNRMSLMEEFY